MKRSSRWSRLPWLLGLALLTASLVGAGHVLQSRPTDPAGREGKSSGEHSGYPTSAGAVCRGMVDIENGYMNCALAPVQPGEVTEVLVYEGQTVRKGDILLRVNDEPFVIQAAKAEVGVALAEAQLAQARQLTEQHRLGLEQQKSAIEAAQAKIRSAEALLKRAKGLLENGLSNADAITAGAEEINALKAALAVDKTKLRALEALTPDNKIEEAAKNVELRKQDLKAAQLALKHCKLEAPADGTILRLNVAPGVVLGPQTRQAPIMFVPNAPRIVRAEVEQEFAHRVHLDQPALIQDEANSAATWQGKVKRLSDAFLPRRTSSDALALSNGPETRYLEFLVELAPTQTPPRLGLHVRVNLGTRN